MVEFMKRTNGIDIKGNNRAIRRLRTQCEKAKRTLSTSQQTVIECEALAEGEDLHIKISRAKFEALNMELFLRTLPPMEECLKDAECLKSEVDEIVIVGGSTRIPRV